jgi:hypothetical protein
MADIIYEDYYGSVIKVDGTCYNFWKEVPDDPTQDPPPDDLFDTCEECASSQADESSPSFPEESAPSFPEESSAPEASALPPPSVVDCNDCDPPLAETYTVELSGLVEPWAPWNGTTVVTWDAAYGSCTWVDDTGKLTLYFYGAAWWIEVAPTATDVKKFWFLSGDCDPLGLL